MTQSAFGTKSDVDLTDLEAAFNEAPDGDLPDGEYDVTVEKTELRLSRYGNRMLEWHLRIDGPTCRGERVWKTHTLETPENVTFLKKDLAKCGVKLARLSVLPEHLDELVGLRLLVRVRNKDGFANIYFKRRLDGLAGNGSSDSVPPF